MFNELNLSYALNINMDQHEKKDEEWAQDEIIHMLYCGLKSGKRLKLYG